MSASRYLASKATRSEPLPAWMSRGMGSDVEHKGGEAVRAGVGGEAEDAVVDPALHVVVHEARHVDALKAFDDVIVFLRLERAGGVDDVLVRQRDCAREQLPLQRRERWQVVFAQAPLEFGILADGAGSAARRVEENGVEFSS